MATSSSKKDKAVDDWLYFTEFEYDESIFQSPMKDLDFIRDQEGKKRLVYLSDGIESHIKKKEFSDFINKLVDYVRDVPILFDTRIKSEHGVLRSKVVQNKWNSFGENENVPGYCCYKAWEKVRKEYFYLRKLQDQNNPEINKFEYEKYLDGRFGFLESVYNFLKKKFQEPEEQETQNAEVLPVPCDAVNPIQKIKLRLSPFSDIELKLISLVKERRILYDTRIKRLGNLSRVKAIRELWTEVAESMKMTEHECKLMWTPIRDNYCKYRKNAAKGVARPAYVTKYEVLSFMAPVYAYDEDGNMKYSERENNISRSAVDESNNSGEDEENKESKEHIKVYDSDLEIEENMIWEDGSNSTNSEVTQPLESATKQCPDSTVVESCPILSSTSVEIKTEPMTKSLLDHHRFDTLNFFKEMGKYVNDQFPEKRQKAIRLKAWALITKAELNMLQE